MHKGKENERSKRSNKDVPNNNVKNLVAKKSRGFNHPNLSTTKDSSMKNKEEGRQHLNVEENMNSNSSATNCQKCHRSLSSYEVTGLSDCEHRFCADCAQASADQKSFMCHVCQREYHWFFQLTSGNKFFVGSFDPLRAAIVETVNQSKDLITEFQNKIIANFNDVKGHYTEMLTRLYVSLKHLQSTMIWDDIQAFKIKLTDNESRTMLDLYWALTEISKCRFFEQPGAEKPNIIDDITDNIPYIIWLRKHLLKLEKYLDPCVLSLAMLKRPNDECEEEVNEANDKDNKKTEVK